jgi:hypothetical protein
MPLSQFSKMLVTLCGEYKVESTWMTDHIDLANEIGRINISSIHLDDK